jgi:hypothetical protein
MIVHSTVHMLGLVKTWFMKSNYKLWLLILTTIPLSIIMMISKDLTYKNYSGIVISTVITKSIYVNT